MTVETDDLVTTAARFVNSTSSHIFLTGKAGTGKTTFLRSLAERTHKNFVVVAPTGIAALNAGGVTIHSQFLLPFGTFLPDRSPAADFNTDGNFYTQNTLARKNPLNSLRKQVLRAIDLLVIDEVSMLRPDVLDAIDYRMKHVKGNHRQSFGGVQLLLIGDLFQLPPIVNRSEENYVRRYYATNWFFESRALQQDGFVYIELDKIYRQHDDKFIAILNRLRNNETTKSDIDELNTHFKRPEEIRNMREVITLTTHNRIADELNQRALNELKTPARFFDAKITDDFPENMFPVLQRIELKDGAQIMFIKNDNDGKAYFNGKLATVTRFTAEGVEVEMAGTHNLYWLKTELWENKKYSVNANSRELDEDIIGTFEQFPIKLAWAITVHKSQGLTFENAIIDVGQAFADGQVYVALSRLRSLDGLILRTRIDPSVISTDRQVSEFTKQKNDPAKLPQVLKESQLNFIRQLIGSTFDFSGVTRSIDFAIKDNKEAQEFDDESMKPTLQLITEQLLNEKVNTEKFRTQLTIILDSSDTVRLLERIKKGSEYYKTFLNQNVMLLLQHMAEMSQRKKVKTYLSELGELDQAFTKKLEEVDKSSHLIEMILSGTEQFDFSKLNAARLRERQIILDKVKIKTAAFETTKEPRKRKAGKSDKSKKTKEQVQNTVNVTLELRAKGLPVGEIAKARELTVGTIEGHFAKAIGDGRLKISDVMNEETQKEIEHAISEMPSEVSATDVYNKLGGRFGYGALRAVQANMELKKTKATQS